ncbi:MAG TPA: cell wall hydrolase [Sphingomicrobium sp.]|nr:cell wall hydrolase [Sphingomicrobium sp.]
MTRLLGGRGASAVVGLFMLAIGSSASAQATPGLTVAQAVKALDVDAAAQPLGKTSTLGQVGSLAATLARPAVAATTAVANSLGNVFQAQPAQSVTLHLAPSIATEAAWLYRNGWPLYALADRYGASASLDQQTNCLATAVYFEARGESPEGQLAVARVVMNRAASGKYPTDWCSVMKQPWQFSFVNPRTGNYPSVNLQSTSWARAEGIARLAVANIVPSVSTDVLWYHADYVAPSWGHRLNIAQKIGQHIFYRA